jgi:hypothetical protein
MVFTMSTRSQGLVGKTYKSASEAFKDADYASAIERPQQSDFGGFGAFCGGMLFLAVFSYSFWKTIS